MAVVSFLKPVVFGSLEVALRHSREGSAVYGAPAQRDCYGRRRRLREWRARKKILRRHRGDSGLTVSIEVSGSRTGHAIFIIIRISEPETTWFSSVPTPVML